MHKSSMVPSVRSQIKISKKICSYLHGLANSLLMHKAYNVDLDDRAGQDNKLISEIGDY